MATPKTDIEQSVGRILREKHSSPVVVDIIDSHDLFQNQWRKRKIFYKKENYKIIYISSINYTSDKKAWTTIFTPNLAGPKEHIKTNKKSISKNSISSNSSTDKSIANESEEEQDDNPSETKDKYLCGKCLISFKK
jgi:hypothetical protein